MSFIYIASPYTHTEAWMRHRRFEDVANYTAKLIKAGKVVYSPIVHNHPLAVRYDLPTTFEFWEKFDCTFVKLASELHVLRLDGWEKSKGVAGEIACANEHNIPIIFADLEK